MEHFTRHTTLVTLLSRPRKQGQSPTRMTIARAPRDSIHQHDRPQAKIDCCSLICNSVYSNPDSNPTYLTHQFFFAVLLIWLTEVDDFPTWMTYVTPNTDSCMRTEPGCLYSLTGTLMHSIKTRQYLQTKDVEVG